MYLPPTPVHPSQVLSAWRQSGIAPKLLGKLMGKSFVNLLSTKQLQHLQFPCSLYLLFFFISSKGEFREQINITLSVPQVANNMQLFLPEMDPSQDSEPGMYVRVPPGVSPGLQSPTGRLLAWKTQERWAVGNPEPSKSSLGQSIPLHLSNAERATWKTMDFISEWAPAFNSLSKSTSNSVFFFSCGT